MKNSQLLIIGLKLCLICAVAALCLGLLNEVTEPQIEARKAQEEEDALARLVPRGKPGGKIAVEGGNMVRAYYVVGGAVERFILDLRGAGYGGDMKILAAYESDGTVVGATLLDNQETPGLGKKAEDPSYMDKYVGRGSVDNPVPTSKEMLQAPSGMGKVRFRVFPGQAGGGGADAVSGATVTFLGVSRALAEGSEYVKRQWGGR